MTAPLQPARTLREANQQFRFDQPLAYDDPRYVDTAKARGDFSRPDHPRPGRQPQGKQLLPLQRPDRQIWLFRI